MALHDWSGGTGPGFGRIGRGDWDPGVGGLEVGPGEWGLVEGRSILG